MSLDQFLAVFLRKDPPVDTLFRHMLQLFSLYEEHCFFLNKPSGILWAHEKLSALRYPQYIPETCISSQKKMLVHFIKEKKDTILKPLEGFGGKGFFD